MWMIPRYFKTEQSLLDRLRNQTEIPWIDWKGRLLAVESQVQRGKDGKVTVSVPLRLDFIREFDEKILDFGDVLGCAAVERSCRRVRNHLEPPVHNFEVDAIRSRRGLS